MGSQRYVRSEIRHQKVMHRELYDVLFKKILKERSFSADILVLFGELSVRTFSMIMSGWKLHKF